MASLFQLWYTAAIPRGAERTERKGKPAVRFRASDGTTVTAPFTKKGDRIRLQVAVWWGKYRDADGVEQREAMSENKTVAQQMLAERVRRAELGRVGVTDPFEKHRQRPLREHLADDRRELEARDNAPRYVELVSARLQALLDGCSQKMPNAPTRRPTWTL